MRVAVTTMVSGAVAGSRVRERRRRELRDGCQRRERTTICARDSPGPGPRAGARHVIIAVARFQTRAPRRRLRHCRRDGFPRSYQRTPADNRTTARGRSPGFRVIARVLLPKASKSSVDSRTFARRLQLRGQPRYCTAFQFKSLAGTLRFRRDDTRYREGVNPGGGVTAAPAAAQPVKAACPIALFAQSRRSPSRSAHATGATTRRNALSSSAAGHGGASGPPRRSG